MSPATGGAMEARPLMRFAVMGAGAIGAYVGAMLAKAGEDVHLIARGAHLAAMQARGVCVRSERGTFTVHPPATCDGTTIGAVDCVVMALKAHQIAAALPALESCVGPQTHVIAMQNGIPWWYFQHHGGEFEGMTLERVDPGGTLARTFDPNRVVGCAVHCCTEVVAPGVIQHVAGMRFSLGLPSGETTETLRAIAAAFVAGGFEAPLAIELRRDVWVKLLGNVCFNPISALTRATVVDMATHALVAPLLREMMAESLAIAARLGIDLDLTVDERIDGARRVGAHKTSTLQDIEARRPLEIDCMVGAVVELGERLGLPVSATRHVYALTKLLDETQRTSVRPAEARGA
ncbi:MAG: 2-dehydropantoate 2-reductase [Vulcanimicrobiaceae bacterium]